MADNVTAPQFQIDVNNTADWANGDENTTVTMRLGQQADSPAKTINDIKLQAESLALLYGYNPVGLFADGFIYTNRNDVGIDANGDSWIYTGALPFAVTAGTVPSEPTYKQVTFNSAESIQRDDTTVDGEFSRSVDGGIKIDATGLSVEITGIQLVNESGQVVTKSASINIPANSVKFVYYNLYTDNLHLFDRAIDNTMLLVCLVVSDASSVTSIRRYNRMPETFVQNFLSRRLQVSSTNIRDIRVAINGDSIMQGAGDTPYWPDIIFNSANSGLGFNISPSTLCYDVYNYAAGGQTAEFVNATLGKGVETLGINFDRSMVNYDHILNSRKFSVPSTDCGVSKQVRDPYDLIIIGAGANPSTYSLFAVEAAIRNAKKTGSDVIVVTQNFKQSDQTYLEQQTLRLARVCEANGVALVDTWEYYSEAVQNGLNPFADDIHGSQLGQQLYAEAIMGVIGHDYKLKPAYRNVASPVIRGTEFPNASSYPQAVEIQFTPQVTTGAVSASGLNTLNNMAVQIGGKDSSSNDIIELEVGEYAEFGHEYMANADLLVVDDTAFEAQFSTANGSTNIGSPIVKAAGTNRVAMVAGVGISTINGTAPNRTPKALRITCTSGTIKLMGLAFKTDYRSPVLPSTKFGTWLSEDWLYSIPNIDYTDTVNDSISYEYTGSDFVLNLSAQNAAGIVDIYRDGELVEDGLDLYSTTSLYQQVKIRSGIGGNANIKYNSRDSKHVVTVVLVGVNGSASAPSATNRRLGIVSATAVSRN